MRWDHEVTIINGGGATADPVAAPATVPAAACFRLPARDRGATEQNTQVILNLQAPTAESVSVELYALDDADDTGSDMPPAAGQWTRLFAVTDLAGGRARSFGLFAGGDGSALQSGGYFYLRTVAETVAADRPVQIAARPGNGVEGGISSAAVNIIEVAGTAVADAADGVLPVAEVPQVVVAQTSIIDDAGGPPVGPVAITVAYVGTASLYQDLDDACTELHIEMITGGTAPTSIEIEVLWDALTAAGGAAVATSFCSPAINMVVGGQVQMAPREDSYVGRLGAVLPTGGLYKFPPIPREIEAASYSVRVKRTGGAADTAAQILATQVG